MKRRIFSGLIAFLAIMMLVVGSSWPQGLGVSKAQANLSEGLLFADNFNDGNADGWTISGDNANWNVRDGHFGGRLEGRRRYGFASAGDPSWTDYVFEANVLGEEGVDKCLLFHYRDDNNNYGVVLRSLWQGRASVSLFKREAGVWTTEIKEQILPNDLHTWYRLKISLEERRIRVWVNDVFYIDHVDQQTNLTSGQIALTIHTGDRGVSAVRFDNVEVRGLEPPVGLSVAYLDAVQVVDGQDIPLVKGKDTAIKVRVKNTGTTEAHNVRVSVTANGVGQGTVTRNRFYREERATQQTDFVFTGDPEDHLDTLNAGEEKTLYFFDDNGAFNPVGVENATSWYTVSANVACDEGAMDTEQLTKEIVEPTWYKGSQEFRVAYVPIGLPVNEITWRLWDQIAHWQQDISDLLRARIPVDKAKFVIDPPVYNLNLPLRLYRNPLGVITYEEYVHWCQDAVKWLTVGLRPDATNTLYILVLPQGWHATNLVWYNWPLLMGSVPVVESSYRLRVVLGEYLLLKFRDPIREVYPHEVGHWINPWEVKDSPDDCIAVPGGLWVAEKRALYPVVEPQVGNTYTYCPVSWISPRDYRILLRGFSTKTEVMSSSGASDADDGAVVVSGWIARNGEAGFDSAWIVPEGTPDIDQLHSGASEEYRLQVLDRSGAVLFDHPLLVIFDDPWGGQTDKTYFLASIPNYHSAAEIRLLHQEVSIAAKTISNNSPVVEILSPQPGEVVRGDFTIRWRGTDADRDPLSYYVSVSADNGQNWMGAVEAGGEITATEVIWHSNQEVPPGTTYRVRVRVSDGYHSTTATSGSFSVQGLIYLPLLGKAPTPTPTPTATPTKTLAPTPTVTPIPTATPVMGSATIWGRCLRDGNPLVGVEISIGSGDGSSTWEPKSRTNNEGYFHFFGVQVPPGGTTYGLWPTNHPYCRQSVHVNDRDYVGPLIFNFNSSGQCY